ncbi:hypothetical protein ROZALSC1DRAFT_27245 [Rozella allomycis CSF55]|uniref:Uncharacterized protein n=1 Tax=Rozella allomycis (strain CSF55) TaxID=988480 RepID=A0A4P9YNN0_ROZAC|nr:hypothetical protein ROZALSC1DRAFT_27245 [Rozella allomycis CSF55]
MRITRALFLDLTKPRNGIEFNCHYDFNRVDHRLRKHWATQLEKMHKASITQVEKHFCEEQYKKYANPDEMIKKIGPSATPKVKQWFKNNINKVLVDHSPTSFESWRDWMKEMKNADDIKLLKDFMLNNRFGACQSYDPFKSYSIIKTCIDSAQIEHLMDMLISRHIYSLNPNEEGFFLILNFCYQECLNSLNEVNDDVFLKKFYSLLQLLPLYNDYLGNVPPIAYSAILSVISRQKLPQLHELGVNIVDHLIEVDYANAEHVLLGIKSCIVSSNTEKISSWILHAKNLVKEEKCVDFNFFRLMEKMHQNNHRDFALNLLKDDKIYVAGDKAFGDILKNREFELSNEITALLNYNLPEYLESKRLEYSSTVTPKMHEEALQYELETCRILEQEENEIDNDSDK